MTFDGFNRIYLGSALNLLREMPDQCVQTCITSPPYFGLRDYGMDGQIGAEKTPAEYVAALVAVFREVRRVLRDDGTVWINLGDSYANDDKWGGSTGGKHAAGLHGESGVGRGKTETGLPPKSRMMIPARVAIALQDDGWILRDEIVWHKPAPMPEPVKDRTTKAHEMIYMLAKQPAYYYDADAIAEPSLNHGWVVKYDGTQKNARAAKTEKMRVRPDETMTVGETRNKRSVWTVGSEPAKAAHFAVFPTKLIEPCILASAPAGGVVLDPFMGTGRTALVARYHGRQYIGIELNPKYVTMANRSLRLPFEIQPAVETDISDLPLFAAGS